MDKSNKEYWKEVIQRYRLSKKVRCLRGNMDLIQIAKLTGQSKQYIYGIQEMTIKPNREFIEKINQIKK